MTNPREELLKRTGGGNQRLGGKGTIRRRVRPRAQRAEQAEHPRVTELLGRLNTTTVPGIDKVEFMNRDGTVTTFERPNIQALGGQEGFYIAGSNKTEKPPTPSMNEPIDIPSVMPTVDEEEPKL